MKPEAVINHRLCLVVRLIDSAFGNGVVERDVRFFMNPPRGAPISRGDGTYLFLNIGDEDFELEVRVYGYETAKEKIVMSNLNNKMPIKEIYLLPNDFSVRRDNILTLRGRIPGIEAVEAVSLTGVDCCIKEFDTRSQIMTVLNQHNVRLSHIHYGLLEKNRQNYEHIEIEEQLSPQKIKLKGTLTSEFEINQPISRIIFGKIESNGNYLLKVPNGGKADYLVRFTTGKETIFKKVNFNMEEVHNV